MSLLSHFFKNKSTPADATAKPAETEESSVIVPTKLEMVVFATNNDLKTEFIAQENSLPFISKNISQNGYKCNYMIHDTVSNPAFYSANHIKIKQSAAALVLIDLGQDSNTINTKLSKIASQFQGTDCPIHLIAVNNAQGNQTSNVQLAELAAQFNIQQYQTVASVAAAQNTAESIITDKFDQIINHPGPSCSN